MPVKIGFYGCGKTGLDILKRAYMSNHVNEARFVEFVGIDLTEVGRITEDLRREGYDIKNLYPINPDHEIPPAPRWAGGVGGGWKLAMDFMNEVLDLTNLKMWAGLEDHERNIAAIFHSAGGGTGAGTGPVLARILREYFIEKEVMETSLIIPFVFLPHMNDARWRFVNAAITLTNYNELARSQGDSIPVFLADNEKFRRIYPGVWRDYVDDAAIMSIRGLTMASFYPDVIIGEKDIDVKDIINSLVPRGGTPRIRLVVPCRLEMYLDFLRHFSVLGAIKLCLMKYSLANVRTPAKALFIGVFPYDIVDAVKHGKPLSGTRAKISQELKDIEDKLVSYLEELGLTLADNPVITGSKAYKNSFAINIYLIDPQILSLYKVYELYKKTFEDDFLMEDVIKRSLSSQSFSTLPLDEQSRIISETKGLVKQFYEEFEELAKYYRVTEYSVLKSSIKNEYYIGTLSYQIPIFEKHFESHSDETTVSFRVFRGIPLIEALERSIKNFLDLRPLINKDKKIKGKISMTYTLIKDYQQIEQTSKIRFEYDGEFLKFREEKFRRWCINKIVGQDILVEKIGISY